MKKRHLLLSFNLLCVRQKKYKFLSVLNFHKNLFIGPILHCSKLPMPSHSINESPIFFASFVSLNIVEILYPLNFLKNLFIGLILCCSNTLGEASFLFKFYCLKNVLYTVPMTF